MKPLSSKWWAKAASAAELLTEDDIRVRLRSRLAEPAGKDGLAARLGISVFRLTGILRGRFSVDDALAQRLGYRRVVRFERIE